MSTEIVRQFLSAASSDSALKQKLAAATDSVNFVQIAQKSGYNFTLEDLQAYIAQHNNGELSEEQLEAVAGGGHCPDAAGGNWPPIRSPGRGGGGPGGRPTWP
jgi:predicted ribosomally synthesized peptide with nif11-like leader